MVVEDTYQTPTYAIHLEFIVYFKLLCKVLITLRANRHYGNTRTRLGEPRKLRSVLLAGLDSVHQLS
jgi:hypothetical protein